MTKPFEWDGNHLLVSRGGPMTYRMATTADLAAALLAAPAEVRDQVMREAGVYGNNCAACGAEWMPGTTLDKLSELAEPYQKSATAAEARVAELEAELADVRRLGRQLRVIVDSYDRSQYGDLTEEEFQGTIEEARLMLASGAKP